MADIPAWDSIVSMYVGDANDSTLALVELGKLPMDSTWEVLHGDGWEPWTGADVYLSDEEDTSMLVVARPIGSGR